MTAASILGALAHSSVTCSRGSQQPVVTPVVTTSSLNQELEKPAHSPESDGQADPPAPAEPSDNCELTAWLPPSARDSQESGN